MSPSSDVENGRQQPNGTESTANDERAPLLQQPSHGDDVPSQPRTWGWYAWRGFWAVLAAVIIGLFIKGWIDADDVDVCS